MTPCPRCGEAAQEGELLGALHFRPDHPEPDRGARKWWQAFRAGFTSVLVTARGRRCPQCGWADVDGATCTVREREPAGSGSSRLK